MPYIIIDLQDIGKIIAEILLDKDIRKHAFNGYALSGSATGTFNELQLKKPNSDLIRQSDLPSISILDQ